MTNAAPLCGSLHEEVIQYGPNTIWSLTMELLATIWETKRRLMKSMARHPIVGTLLLGIGIIKDFLLMSLDPEPQASRSYPRCQTSSGSMLLMRALLAFHDRLRFEANRGRRKDLPSGLRCPVIGYLGFVY